MIVIEKEQAADAAAIESLLDIGFGADRLSKTVYRLRQGPSLPDLSLVARTGYDASIGASIRFWPVEIGVEGAPVTPALLLGPLVVDPALRGKGLGRTLVARALEDADEAGWPLCLVVGEPSYYRPFGFEPAAPYGFELPGPVDWNNFQVRGAPALMSSLHGEITVRRVEPWSGCATGVEEAYSGFRAA